MTTKKSEIITRDFIITQKELKEKLGLTGDILRIDLWAGLSPLENNVSGDTIEWLIVTEERIKQLGDKKDV